MKTLLCATVAAAVSLALVATLQNTLDSWAETFFLASLTVSFLTVHALMELLTA